MSTLDTLKAAESFISGFEDDPLQEGIPALLESLRAEIATIAPAEPTRNPVDLLDCANGFHNHEGESETCRVCGERQDEPENRWLEVADTLEAGASADIWYDARDHGDTEMEELIEDVQAAMIAAARTLRNHA